MDSCYSSGKPLNKDLLDENISWRDTIETLQNELSEVGVGEGHTQELACFLYASHLNHQPLLLAGPYGALIADAFSASLCGKTAGVFVVPICLVMRFSMQNPATIWSLLSKIYSAHRG